MYQVDLNCDLGEGFGQYKIGNDEEILKHVTSVNVACGFHAGDPVIMERTVKMAIKRGVAIGAHPGFPDLIGFGRRNMQVRPEEIKAYIIYQIGALKGFIKAHGGKLQHVKPHGALYNMAAKDYTLAKTIAEAVYSIDKKIILVGLANSSMIDAAKKVGLPVVQEVFADRNYNNDGSLVSRTSSNSMIDDVDLCYKRVLQMVKEKTVISLEGNRLQIDADTICLHGDHPQAVKFASRLKELLLADGVKLNPMGQTLQEENNDVRN